MWRLVGVHLNPALLEDKDYVFKCMEPHLMLESLASADGQCDIGVGGLTLSKEREDLGIRMTQVLVGWAAAWASCAHAVWQEK